MEKLYPAGLLEHARRSPYRKVIADADATTTIQHPSCGDRISYTVRFSGGLISDIGFEAVGCILSQAAASLLAEAILGSSLAAIKQMTDAQMLVLIGLELGPTRAQCALLPLHAVRTL